MAKRRRRLGKATRAITDPLTGRVLGWAYEWDNGEDSSLASEDVPPHLRSASDEAGAGQGGSRTDEEGEGA